MIVSFGWCIYGSAIAQASGSASPAGLYPSFATSDNVSPD